MFTVLNIKTNNTLLSSMIKIDELIQAAKKNKITCLGIADTNMFGALDFYKACLDNNIKPLIGLDIEGLILYAENYEGYQNLLKLSTIKTDKEITLNILEKYSKNILCITTEYEKYKDIFQNTFKGYKNNEIGEIYINDVLYINKDDEDYLKYLLAIKEGKLVGEIDYKTNNNHLIPLYKEENNNKIKELCNLEIKFNNDLLPTFETPNNNSYEYLKKLCIEGVKQKFGNSINSVYQKRLKYELDVINNMGFCNYFLIVYDYVKYAKDNKILVGSGRGSAAGSLVAYLLNITDVDPIKYNLLFERFLNPERVTMPDIDIDFENTRRDEVINYCIKKYGTKKVAPVIAFGTLTTKQVIRDVSRTLNIPLKQVDNFTKLLDAHKTLKTNLENEKVKKYLNINSNIKNVYKIALKFEGLKRHTTIHAAAIVMSNTDLDNILPLVKNNETYLTGYSMEHLEELGLLKMDFLSLSTLTSINDILKDIKEIDYDNIPFNDSKALNIFNKANTIGIFQFESNGMINFMKKLKPNTFEDLFAANALFRPGPMDNIDSYIRRKEGKEKIDYLDPSLEEILKPTYGIIVYQEQIMRIVRKMANFTFGEADILRRAMSKKKENVLKEKEAKFIEGSIKNNYSKETAIKVYNYIYKFASYGFNRSHSVAYAMISYKMAYLKAYFPKAFMKSLLSGVIGNSNKTKEYIYESKKNNTNILPIDINLSGKNYVIEQEGLRFPLNGVKNVGINAVKQILEERNKKKFKDIFDFTRRCYKESVNKKTLENLILVGAFDNLSINRKTLINNLDVIINYAEIGTYLEDDIFKPVIQNENEYSSKELMKFELEILGLYLTNNPITLARLNYPNTILVNDVSNYFNRNINIVLSVDRIKEITTKNNEKMCFITCSDEVSNIDVVLFPEIYKKNNEISLNDIVLIKGKVTKRFDNYQIIVNHIQKI